MPRKSTFKGGIHPPHDKSSTEHLSIEPLPAPAKIVIPLSQHIGAPAKPIVKRGDRVLIGQVLGEASGFVSTNIHSSVSGTVLTVSRFAHPLGRQVTAIEIENDGKDESLSFSPQTPAWREAAPGELIQQIQAAGIVGMGGASFPTHVKLSPPSNKPIDTLIINGAECEPFLTADHRLMLERTFDLVTGALILKKILGAKRGIIAVEENKPDAIAMIEKHLTETQNTNITLCILATKYPQGGEKQLIDAISGNQVPSGGLPMDARCVVQNIGTAVAIADAILHGIPLYQRVVTVTGPGLKNPKNLLVRIGTPIRLLLESCEIDFKVSKKVIMGGPMMGIAQSDLDVPVIKSTSGLLAYTKSTPAIKTYPCINCGHCVKVCPIHLVPSRIAKYVENEDIAAAQEWNIMDCMECGSCAYVCPAKINLVHFMKLGKYHVLAARAAAQAQAQKP